MDYRNLTNLLIKITGVALIAYSIIEIPAYISYYISSQVDSFWGFIGISLVPMFVPILVGIVFLFFPATVTNKLISGDDETNTASIDILAAERIAFSTLGLYLLFRVISDLIFHGTSIYLALKAGTIARYNTGYQDPYALVVATLAELIFALWLLFGSAGLVRFVSKIRTAGT